MKPKVGVLSFTDERSTLLGNEKDAFAKRMRESVKAALKKQGFDPVDPVAPLGIPAVRTRPELNAARNTLAAQQPDCLVLCMGAWTEPALVTSLVRDLKLPVLLYTEVDRKNNLAGIVLAAAVGASLWEVAPNEYAVEHERVLGDRERVVRWCRAACALAQLRRSSILLWGGSYCLKMDHLQDDFPTLKSFLVGDILTEDQLILTRRADRILQNDSRRVERFIRWLRKNGAKIEISPPMLTDEVLKRQIALYLAAEDRLSELAESGEEIACVSVKCQPELSVEYGVTACSIPTFLPFGASPSGKKQAIPAVCEGDTKGAITSALLHLLAPDVPPLFGDLEALEPSHLMLSNCGGASLYWAGMSNKTGESLSRLYIRGQCQGATGGAYGYSTPPGPVTVARLIRRDGEYVMQLGFGKVVKATRRMIEENAWGASWPHTAISFGLDHRELFGKVGSNHFCATTGDFTSELEWICKLAGITIERLDRASTE
jgi:L-fucose isomerase-like protein